MPNYSLSRFGKIAVALAAAAGLFGQDVWETRGFDAFRRGDFNAGGANLYVSGAGRLQTVHRWDVNNDGYFDLIFNNTHDLAYVVPTEEFRFGDGRRGVSRRVEYAGAGAVRVRVADLNGDQYPELIVTRGFDNSTRVQNSWVYWGSKDGWQDRFHAELLTPHVTDVCIGDLNGDKRPDLIFISSNVLNGNSSLVYWGRADGYFHNDRTAFATPGATGCLAGDFDHDGKTDLLVTGQQTKVYWSGKLDAATAVVLENTRNAALLGSRVALSTAKGPVVASLGGRVLRVDQRIPMEGAGRLTVGDLNRDKLPDLIVTHPSAGREWSTTSRVFLAGGSPGKETFSASQELPTLGASEAAIADLDGDGFPDLIFANSRDNLTYDVDSYIYWGDGSGRFSPERRTAVPTHEAEGVAAYGRNVVFANSAKGRITGDIDTYIYLGNEQGAYSTSRMLRLPTIGGYESCTADLNDDGFADALLVGSHEGDLGGSVGSYIYWGAKDGLSAGRRTEVPTRGAIGCAIADLNRDGYLDLIFSNMEDNTVQILYGGKDGYSSRREQNLQVRDPRFPSVADVNNDGYLDILAPSIRDGLVIYFGSSKGFSESQRKLIPSVGLVSQQVADLDGDGYLDIVLCNLMDTARSIYQGINSQILWGSASGFSTLRRSELPSLGAHHAVVADYNHDGYLDIFLSNYQSEYTRSIDSYLYWGGADGAYSAARRLALHNESAAGVVAADLNGDGWVDLAVSNHVKNGDHHAESLIFWNRSGTFSPGETTALPTIGPHMMTGVDPGNLYTRKMEEVYQSAPHDAGAVRKPAEAAWEGETPFGSRVAVEVRGAASRESLAKSSWTSASQTAPARWWQYRLLLQGGRASWPVVTAVKIRFVN